MSRLKGFKLVNGHGVFCDPSESRDNTAPLPPTFSCRRSWSSFLDRGQGHMRNNSSSSDDGVIRKLSVLDDVLYSDRSGLYVSTHCLECEFFLTNVSFIMVYKWLGQWGISICLSFCRSIDLKVVINVCLSLKVLLSLVICVYKSRIVHGLFHSDIRSLL